MTNGNHKHFCRTHGDTYECAKVTHCREAREVAECPECAYSELCKGCYRRPCACLPNDAPCDPE